MAAELCGENLEARVGFEPTNGGFADLSLRPLGYRAELNEYSEICIDLSGPRAAPSEVFVLHPNNFMLIKSESKKFYRKAVTTCASRINRADSSGGVGQI